VWQRVWDECGRAFRLLAAAQDVQGEMRVRPVIEEAGVRFPVLVDSSSELGRLLGFRVVPTGFFIDAGGVVRYRHANDFDVADPRVRWNLERFLAGEETESPGEDARMDPAALELFAEGVSMYAAGRAAEAVVVWRRALEQDPDNFIIRSQIWAIEQSEHFYPRVDRAWQELQLLKEGYDKPLP